MVFCKKMMKVNWVCCDTCERWDLFDNVAKDLGVDTFDGEVLSKLVYQCRQCKFEFDVRDRFDAIERRISEMEEIELSLGTENSCNEMKESLEFDLVVVEGSLQCQVDDLVGRVEELDYERVKLQTKLDELAAKREDSDLCQEVCKSNLAELAKKFSSLDERLT